MIKYRKYLAIILILLLAGFLRLFQLSSLPVSLFGDEIDVGYQSWSLISTAKDYTGHFLPTYIQSLTESRAPLLMYITAPFVGLLGMNGVSVRLPSALLGLLNIILLFKLLKLLFPDTKTKFIFGKVTVSVIAAFLLATAPWHIHYSRGAFEVTLLLSLLLSGTILFVSEKVLTSFIFFVLSGYTYSTASVFVPLFVICLFLIYRPALRLKRHLPSAIVALLLVLPLILNVIAGSAADRFKGISIFSDTKAVDTIVVTRTEPWVLGSRWESFFHNKPLLHLKTFSSQYISALSPEYLFLNGDPNFRHSIGEFGELFVFLAPFFFIGFYSLFSRANQKGARLLLCWLALSPIPSALTQGGGNHATRLFIALPAIISLIAFGVYDTLVFLEQYRLKLIGLVVFVLFVFSSLFFFWHRYSSHYRFLSYRNWQYGYESVLSNLPILNPGNKLFINNTYEPSILKYLFFAKVSPAYFQKTFTGDVTVDNIYKDISGYKFGDIVFFVSPSANIDLGKLMNPGDLYMAVQGKEIPGDWDWTKNPPKEFIVLRSSRDQFGNPLFYLIQKK